MGAGSQLLDRPIDKVLEIPDVVVARLQKQGILTMRQLLGCPEETLLQVPGIGQRLLQAILDALGRMGFRLGSVEQVRGSCGFCECEHAPSEPFGCEECGQCAECCSCDEDEDDEDDEDEGVDLEFTDQFDTKDEEHEEEEVPFIVIAQSFPPLPKAAPPLEGASPLLKQYVDGLCAPGALNQLERDLQGFLDTTSGPMFARLRQIAAEGSPHLEGAANELMRYLARFALMTTIMVAKAKAENTSKDALPDDLFN